jgi:ketosteroid isomerase-like protein
MSRGGIEVEPTGNPIEYRGVDVISIEDGRVARLDVYADGETLLRQLGIAEIG